MRCPDCGSDIVLKPEVVVQKEPCKCGTTEFTRIARYFLFAVITLMLCLTSSCWVVAYHNAKIATKGDVMFQDGTLIPKKQ